MKKTPCKEYEERLVDYADGDLPREEMQEIARHVDRCETCRRTVQALDRSLGLAQEVWLENLADPGATPRVQHAQKSRRFRSYAVAAGILLGISAAVTLFNNRLQPTPDRLEDVQQQIARVGAAAELLAATQLLAHCEGTDAIVERQYRYILEEYAGTPAAKSIRAQYGSSLGDLQ